MNDLSVDSTPITAGGAIFAKLKGLGVDYVFVNSGTDFPPVIEGLAQAAATGARLPAALVIPHEHAALGMAHGCYLASGRAQAVMLHTNVGLANGVIGAINAATERVPVLLMSGRTPTTEQGRFGSRTVPIGWGQEMRDQTALVREACKWDYELRFPEQLAEVLDRAWGIANSTPKGPVYLSLPREVLCEPCPVQRLDRGSSMQPAQAAAPPDQIARVADLLAAAERPLIVAQRGAGSAAGFATLARLADDWAIPVCQYWAVQQALASDHPMSVGADPQPWLGEADLVLVVDSLAPWEPQRHAPRDDAVVVQLGPDPLYSRFPIRNFRADIALAGETAPALRALESALRPRLAGGRAAREVRRAQIAGRVAETRARILAEAERGRQTPLGKAYVSLCLARALERFAGGRRVSILSELGCPPGPLNLGAHDAWYQEPHSGGLGWSLPCALGMQLARPEQLVVATMGDGSYLFANPTACHQIMEAYDLPVLTLILNNAEWGAVRRSVQGLYPHGQAVKANRMPLTSLAPSPDFTKTAAASRVWAEQVKNPDALPQMLERALRVVLEQRHPALLDIAVGG